MLFERDHGPIAAFHDEKEAGVERELRAKHTAAHRLELKKVPLR